jgi:hypothetical protein
MPVLVRLIFLIFLLTLDVSVVLGQANSLSWKLAWSDEFNYTGLPDTGKWGYEHGFVRNNEK